MNTKIDIVSLVDAGVHFGHQTRRWNPKMKPYIFTARKGVHIINLKQSLVELDRAYSFVRDLAAKGGTLLFVGTKKQAQEPIAAAAERCGMPYVNHRWLGGMLTNFVTIRSRVTHMEELEGMEADGRMATLPKKEQISLHKELAKLQANLNGVRNMTTAPQAIFVVDTMREEIAISEARRLGIKIIGILDTNADPEAVEYGIPGNDDAIRSVTLLVDIIAAAVVDGATAEMFEEAEAIIDQVVDEPFAQAPVAAESDSATRADDPDTSPSSESSEVAAASDPEDVVLESTLKTAADAKQDVIAAGESLTATAVDADDADAGDAGSAVPKPRYVD